MELILRFEVFTVVTMKNSVFRMKLKLKRMWKEALLPEELCWNVPVMTDESHRNSLVRILGLR
jgi:hypothetical protein